MSFLTSIAARAAGLAPAVEPRLPSRFEREGDAPSFAEAVSETPAQPPAPTLETKSTDHTTRHETTRIVERTPPPPPPPSPLPVEEAPLRVLIESRETTHVIHDHEHESSTHETTREIVERRADFQSAVAGPPVQRPSERARETVVRPEVERLRTGGPRAERRESAPPTIRVTIGRVDVRAITEPAPAKREPARRSVFTIEDYIRLRKEGRR